MSGDEMMAAMGFTSFGRVHRERERKRKRADVLAQLMPGTELTGKRAEFSVDGVEEGAYGELSLLCKENCSLDAALSENCKIEERIFVAISLLQELEKEKNKFDELESPQFRSARAATNAFELLGKHRFLNRSAMKLVTLDHIFQWTHGAGERFTFADICGGPGGFSEYLLWRTQQSSDTHGYGITLKGAANECDWRLPSRFHDMFTICYGEDGTGDLYSIANIHNFRDVVRGRHPNGVDLALADGGFLDARSKSNQESMMTRLILAEVLAMFAVLRVGGDFVCKTFELVTPAMLELCWILHQCFERFAVVKPITSRPASSERYIVARGLRAGHPTTKLVEILEGRLVQANNNNENSNSQLHFLQEQTPLCEDVDFLQYMKVTNEVIARSQIEACRRINEYAVNKNKRKSREDDIDPREYYQYWQLGRIPRHGSAQ
ncbi:hypothetical protein L915_16622 [Phytophthora nicotianae]|uniref:Cap-specific mRNA (nucleoside-2'-O-)-methyltransferase 1 n=1 Tax=Phytophthora nicotianae TaxID=4792 RepID=W2G4G7_PHYNI|nr:hypothetical protein L915_16622 [Phytophthora nicotianae]ETL30535.1 hypothetical protein L916_16526 [Phytophthora nicotianae]